MTEKRPTFGLASDYARMIGWSVHEVHLVNHHVMFWFENGRSFLNIASRFSHRSTVGSFDYTYDVYGPNTQVIRVQRLLGNAVKTITVRTPIELDIVIGEDTLTVHYDDWSKTEDSSWWIDEHETTDLNSRLLWSVGADTGLRYG